MDHYLRRAKEFVIHHKKKVILATGVVAVCVVIIAVVVALFMYNLVPRIVYQPVKACDLFTPAEARELLGSNVLHSRAGEVDLARDLATSKCGYTDGNADTSAMIVAAINVRSALNDVGVAQNKADFTAGKSTQGMEIVKDLGNDAYFDSARGQLHVLRDHEWIILSYGTGADPMANTLEQAKKLAGYIVR